MTIATTRLLSLRLRQLLQLRRIVPALLLLCAAVPAARAQHNGDFGLTYTQERAKFANAYCQCFPLRGATADISYAFYKGVGIAASAQGLAVSNLRGSIDIHQITFLAGPRYTWNLGRIDPVRDDRRLGIFVQGQIGYTFATQGLFPVAGGVTDHASALTYQGGGGLNYNIYHRFDVRLFEGEYVRTQLPNGGNNQQNTLRLASGISFHIGR
jgi:hypothetical protein